MKLAPTFVERGDWQDFLTLSGEKPLVVTRQHWFVLLQSLLIISFITLPSLLVYGVVSLFLLESVTLFVSGTILIVFIFLTLFVRSIVGWYFHIYLITTRKILEVLYNPLSSYTYNDVLLDQVKCTEVDVSMHGVLNELLDMGSIAIVFDRPTHQEEFKLHNIRYVREVGTLVGNKLVEQFKSNNKAESWYKSKKEPRALRFAEEIFKRVK